MMRSTSRYDWPGAGGPIPTASSASLTNAAFASASLCTATVDTPRSRHARTTRSAISPRLATRTFLNTPDLFDVDDRVLRRHDRSLADEDVGHLAGTRRRDVVLHLHRLEHRDGVAELDVVADLDGNLE